MHALEELQLRLRSYRGLAGACLNGPAAKHQPIDREAVGRVSVVMTSHNTERYIADAVASLLNQTHENCEIIAVDDASTDATPTILRELSDTDSRVRVFRSYQNRGPYWSKNLGLMHATGEFVTFHDSDDISSQERIEAQLRVLQSNPTVACVSNCETFTRSGKRILNRGRYERLHYITLMFRRLHVLPRVGFFDTTRFAADDEFFFRLKAVFGNRAIYHLERPLYRSLVREGQLTQRNRAGLQEHPNDPLGHLSPERREYVLRYRDWHASGDWLFMPFPFQARKFDVPQSMIVSDSVRAEPVTASMASVPQRREGLKRVVDRILPQVDRLNVYLNGYGQVPDLLRHPKIEVARSQEEGDMRDNGKFFWSQRLPDGYHFCLDDDLLYPDNYVDYMISKILQYGKQAIVGVHGTLLPPAITRYFERESRTTYKFDRRLDTDEQVHVLGTGTVAYHSSALSVAPEDFQTTGMADIWFAVLAQEQGVPQVAVSRSTAFLSEFDDLPGTSLYDEFANRDDEQTELVKRYQPWKLPALRVG